jgi:hypothetical protein
LSCPLSFCWSFCWFFSSTSSASWWLSFILSHPIPRRLRSRKQFEPLWYLWGDLEPFDSMFNANFLLHLKIPLFGLQHILFPLRPEANSPLEFPYQLMSAILISLQGFCVSFIFCFANHEVFTAVSCYLHTLCPRTFTTYYRESYYTPGATATMTRDITV